MKTKNTETTNYFAAFFMGAVLSVSVKQILQNEKENKNSDLGVALLGGAAGLATYALYKKHKASMNDNKLIAYDDDDDPLPIRDKDYPSKDAAEKEFYNFFPSFLVPLLEASSIAFLCSAYVMYRSQDEIKGFGNFLLEDNKNRMIDIAFEIFVHLMVLNGAFDDKTRKSLLNLYFANSVKVKSSLNVDTLRNFFNALFNNGFDNALEILKQAFVKSNFFSNEMCVGMSICLQDYARSLFPSVAHLTEKEKIVIFKSYGITFKDTRADKYIKKAVAILLWEFATGTGENIRTFGNCYLTAAFLNEGCQLGSVDKVKYIKEKIRKANLSLEQFKAKGLTIKGIPFSPDDKTVSFKQLYDNHFNSNLVQLFVGGTGEISVMYNGEINGRIKLRIKFKNETSMKSLFLHLADNKSRKNYEYIHSPLSTIIQKFETDIYVSSNEKLFR